LVAQSTLATEGPFLPLPLEALTRDAQVQGLAAGQIARLVAASMVSDDSCHVVYRLPDHSIHEALLSRADEARLALATVGAQWAFDADGEAFKLAAEAYRIDLAYLFDPYMAVHTAEVEPLPHQITAVYQQMLPRQPLRFVLADDPGAGKTVMAGLFIRELLLRAAARKVLIVAPGSLVEQWRIELQDKFGLEFRHYSPALDDASPDANAFEHQPQLIARLDQLARNDEVRDRALATHYDLVIFDEAHKCAASWTGAEIKKTRRYELAEALGARTQHLLLMTATPHNGKEEDFQLFLGLLDADRFHGKFREGAHQVDTQDLMRRMVKEDLLKFDGSKLFPERRAYTARFELSDDEMTLYEAVSSYVREGMQRLAGVADGKRRGSVGFALTSLQRRLASSPLAIHRSLERRLARLRKLDEDAEREGRFAAAAEAVLRQATLRVEDAPDWEDELTPDEAETGVDELVSGATLAQSRAELAIEIAELELLVGLSAALVRSDRDRKWDELSRLLQDTPEMFLPDGSRRKLIIFTEHRDTLNYLVEKVGNMLGHRDAVVEIHGSTPREERLKVQGLFRSDPGTVVLVATDAAGEGVNLQNANLMINYDLPWNPNRLEQRFGRIHRIGQTQVCHLWNLLAAHTREGDVFDRLFQKLEIERQALGGKVFDVLGRVFEERSLKDLLLEAICSPAREATIEEVQQQLDLALANGHLRDVIARDALHQSVLDQTQVLAVREQLELAEARKLQPHFVEAFCLAALSALGGESRAREPGRFEVMHVPAALRERDRLIAGRTGQQAPVLRRYERICFDKAHREGPHGKRAELVHPGHPLMQAILDVLLERHRGTLKQGAMLLDPADEGTEPRLLVILDHRVHDDSGTGPADVSRRLQFVAIGADGVPHDAGVGPHLDLVPLAADARALVAPSLPEAWRGDAVEAAALAHAAAHLAPAHFAEVSARRIGWVDRTREAVRTRLEGELRYWDHRAEQLRTDHGAGKVPWPTVLHARQQVDALTSGLDSRLRELDAMRALRSGMPALLGAAVVVPQGLLARLQGEPPVGPDAEARARVEALAMAAVVACERAQGREVTDVSAAKCGWDVTSRGADGSLRLIEVKGRHHAATTVTVTKNEILTAFNKPDEFVLAIVKVEGERAHGPWYVRRPFAQAPDWAEASRNLDLAALLARATLQETPA
jgi:superfamily II DNA or RNA helicase